MTYAKFAVKCDTNSWQGRKRQEVKQIVKVFDNVQKQWLCFEMSSEQVRCSGVSAKEGHTVIVLFQGEKIFVKEWCGRKGDQLLLW